MWNQGHYWFQTELLCCKMFIFNNYSDIIFLHFVPNISHLPRMITVFQLDKCCQLIWLQFTSFTFFIIFYNINAAGFHICISSAIIDERDFRECGLDRLEWFIYKKKVILFHQCTLHNCGTSLLSLSRHKCVCYCHSQI